LTSLKEMIDTIADSEVSDWSVHRSPTFHYRLIPVRGEKNRLLDFDLREHTVMLSFRQDVRIAMAFGLIDDPNFNEDWCDQFPNKRAQSVFLDFLFSGGLVFRDSLVAVDGWRCALPRPSADQTEPPYSVPERRLRIARLIHRLSGPNTRFEAYFQRAGMRPVKAEWP